MQYDQKGLPKNKIGKSRLHVFEYYMLPIPNITWYIICHNAACG